MPQILYDRIIHDNLRLEAQAISLLRLNVKMGNTILTDQECLWTLFFRMLGNVFKYALHKNYSYLKLYLI
jgi:hypothetical protein